jgi:transcriptional regulator with XRE-family HTH domain
MTNRSRDYNRSVFRELLKSLRTDKAQLTQAELSKALGRPQSYVSKYENGERRLDYVEVLEICQVLGVTMDEFNEAYLRRVGGGREN